MTHCRCRRFTSTVAGWALAAGVSWAGPVQISPPSLDSGAGVIGIAAQQPLGQSFVASGDSIGVVELRLLNLNMWFELSQDRLVTLDLFDGVGFGGLQLASKTVDVDRLLGGLVGAESQVDFDMGGVAVVPGQAYSFQLRAATARFGSVWLSGNPYADGQAILQGQPFDDPDLYFGISAVPEQRSDLLLATGLMLFGWLSFRRRTSRADCTQSH